MMLSMRHAFGPAAEHTDEDWNHINPFGGPTRGPEAVLKDLKEVHSTFSKVSPTLSKRSDRWLIIQDQNSLKRSLPLLDAIWGLIQIIADDYLKK